MARILGDGAMPVVRIGAVVLFTWLAGCRGCEPDYSKTKPIPRGAPQGSRPAAPARAERPRPVLQATPTDLNAPPPISAPPAEPPKTPPRDYAAELLQAVGSPLDCLQARLATDAPSRVSITLEATALESGYITRGSARASTLDAEELACVTRRIERTRLGPNVEAAPRTVLASLTLELKSAPLPVPSTQPEPPPPPGIVTPAAEALPAVAPPAPRDPTALPTALPAPLPTDPNAIPQRLPDPIPLQP